MAGSETTERRSPAAGAVLLLVDVQQAFLDPAWGPRNNPDAEDNIAALLAYWRQHRGHIVHVQHSSRTPGSLLTAGTPGYRPMDCAAPLPGEAVFVKSVNSAFIGTTLEAWLRDAGLQELVVLGFTTDHCVSTTVRMAANLGFGVHLVADATVTFDKRADDGGIIDADTVHRVHIASLKGEFCEVAAAADLLQDGAA